MDEPEEVRTPRLACDPGRPTAREIREHNVTHWPYRSWCRHCVRARGIARHHRRRSAEDREFSKGRVPTISIDHCFLGECTGEETADVESALGNPFLIIYDADTEAIYSLPVATKAAEDWVAYALKSVIDELGYESVKVAIKCDAAPELQTLRRKAGALRQAPTTDPHRRQPKNPPAVMHLWLG